MKVSAIIAGGGKGARFGASIPKQFFTLAGRPMISWSLQAFMDVPFIKEIVVVVPKEDMETVKSIVEESQDHKTIKVAPGGGTRQESVKNGLDAVDGDMEWVAVHDAARPLITPEIIEGVCLLAQEVGAAILSAPCFDTVKEADENGMVIKTLDRKSIYFAQTPQVARKKDLLRAYKTLGKKAYDFTDESSLLEEISVPVGIYANEIKNIKITTKEDLALAEAIMKIKRNES